MSELLMSPPFPADATPRPGVGDFIRLVRHKRRLSQRQLSQKVRRSPAYLSKLEAGDISPSFRGFSEIAVALDMTPREIWTIVRLEAFPTRGGE